MIRGIRLDKLWKTPVRPIKLTTVDDHPANGRAMAADELGGRMNDDISAMFERLQQVRSGQRVIHHERYTILMRDIGYSLNIEGVQARITHGFGKDSLGAIIDGSAEVFGIAAINKAHGDTKFG